MGFSNIMELEQYQRAFARNYTVYCDGITDVSYVAETMAKEYGIGFQVVASTTDIERANAAIKKANETLQREPLRVVLQTLLQRKYQVIIQAETIFAFGRLERDCKTLRGGTAWSVQMALDMEKDVFVYDIETSTWFRSERRYDPIRQKMKTKFCIWMKPHLPALDQSSVIIGSTHIGPITNNAIQHLFHRTFCDNMQDMQRVLEEFEL